MNTLSSLASHRKTYYRHCRRFPRREGLGRRNCANNARLLRMLPLILALRTPQIHPPMSMYFILFFFFLSFFLGFGHTYILTSFNFHIYLSSPSISHFKLQHTHTHTHVCTVRAPRFPPKVPVLPSRYCPPITPLKQVVPWAGRLSMTRVRQDKTLLS
jgi:hypothetical protein